MWVVASERVYYAKGDAGYGRAGEGAYMCEDEARGDGNPAPGRGGVRRLRRRSLPVLRDEIARDRLVAARGVMRIPPDEQIAQKVRMAALVLE